LGLFLRLDGRIGRKAFWVGFASLIAGFFLADLLTRGASIALILAIALIYPLVAVLVKRLHDRGRRAGHSLRNALDRIPATKGLGMRFLSRLVPLLVVAACGAWLASKTPLPHDTDGEMSM